MYPRVEETHFEPMKVLHVDDDPLNLRVVADILAAFGQEAYQAGDGAQALEQLGAQYFDLVLMDIHMPGMTGIEVVRRLRDSVGPERNVPVIALTADVMSRTPSQYLALGFDGFVSKPIQVTELYQTMMRVMAGQDSARQA